ncbi:Uncharacterised protein [Serratia proteamaculans]|uniref:hypothetical protein n=1 Tax=Serratia proteamaculans TaxID=28151 RepID=UPI002182657D|nr:hypothetical protein [Serratia proteamaculans]CAI2483272.1 Uncharacterised protein [Serratia proteamaculans]
MVTIEGNNITILESEMTFGIYDVEHCYLIENSKGHVSLGEGFKMVEFTLLRPEGLYVIEAKKSIPRPNSAPEYDNFWQDILEKMDNALQLHVMAHIRRNDVAHSELPEEIQGINLSTVNFLLRLVIPDVPDKYLPEITQTFRQRAAKLKRKWVLNELHIAVINKNKARTAGLVI